MSLFLSIGTKDKQFTIASFLACLTGKDDDDDDDDDDRVSTQKKKLIQTLVLSNFAYIQTCSKYPHRVSQPVLRKSTSKFIPKVKGHMEI